MSKKNNYRFRIVNKSKDGVTISFSKENQEKFTWKDFNEQFDMDGLYWAILKPETKEKYDKLDKMVNDLAVAVFMSKSKKIEESAEESLFYLAQIRELYQNIEKESGWKMPRIIELVQQRLSTLNGFTSHKSDAPRKPKSNVYTVSTAKKADTLGDLPALQELKKSMSSKSETEDQK